jgi:hypothetical protein
VIANGGRLAVIAALAAVLLAAGCSSASSDVPMLKTDFLPNFQGDEDLGIKADAQGSYAESGSAPESALTPVISAIKAAGVPDQDRDLRLQ